MYLASTVLNRVAPKHLWRARVKRWGIEATEPEMAWLSHFCHPRKLSIDVGASVGGYVAHLLCYSNGCLAFEPQPEHVATLRAMFRGAPVIVEQVALSSCIGVGEMRLTGDRGRSTIHAANILAGVDTVGTLSVSMRPLDTYQLRNVGFIKIDVEGHELAVLRGARNTLYFSRPTLLIEIEERHAPGNLDRVVAFLAALGYVGTYLREGQWHLLEVPPPPDVHNFVFQPRKLRFYKP